MGRPRRRTGLVPRGRREVATAWGLLLLLLLARSHAAPLRRRLQSSSSSSSSSFEPIVGYQPETLVVDESFLDLDQELLVRELGLATRGSLAAARSVYEEGAHSGSFAVVALANPLPASFPAETPVGGVSVAGVPIQGVLGEAAPAGASTLRVRYAPTTPGALPCWVGGNPNPSTDGCFAPEGTLAVGGGDDGAPPPPEFVSYTYDVATGNQNARTLKGLGLSAGARFSSCPACPFRAFQEFAAYYGTPDYAARWVDAALSRETTSVFANGNADFSSYGIVARSRLAGTASLVLTVWMEVVGRTEEALAACNGSGSGNADWDAAVAIYAGSLEGPLPTNTTAEGAMLYALASRLCADFRACTTGDDDAGASPASTTGTAPANEKILRAFVDGRDRLGEGDCAAAREQQETIEAALVLPLVQGVLRSAFEAAADPGGEGSRLSAATHAAAVLPLVHACDPAAAVAIHGELRPDDPDQPVFFPLVRAALEGVYDCLGVVCEDVGGLFDEATSSYKEGAAPCGVVPPIVGSNDDDGGGDGMAAPPPGGGEDNNNNISTSPPGGGDNTNTNHNNIFGPTADLLAKALARGDLAFWVAALEASNLTSTLGYPDGPFTVFAPVDAAFNDLPGDFLDCLVLGDGGSPDLLSAILSYHVVAGETGLSSRELAEGRVLPTLLDGEDVFVGLAAGGNDNSSSSSSNNTTLVGIEVNNATILTPDLNASNGVIHLIDTVLLPSWTDVDEILGLCDLASSSENGTDAPAGFGVVADELGDLATLVTALEATDLLSELEEEAKENNRTGYTIFAPNDSAFGRLPDGLVECLLLENNLQLLSTLMSYHIADEEVFSSDLVQGEDLRTVSGLNLTVNLTDDSINIRAKFSQAAIVVPDLGFSGGVFHVVDMVLVPTDKLVLDCKVSTKTDSSDGPLRFASLSSGWLGLAAFFFSFF